MAEATCIASYPEIARHINIEHVHPLVEEWSGDLDAFRHHIRDPHMLFLDRNLSARDARHIDEVLHEARQVTNLTFDNLTFSLQCTAAAELHQLQRRQFGDNEFRSS